MKMKKNTGIIVGLLLAMICRAEDFDLNYFPKDGADKKAVLLKMLATGAEIAYRTESEKQKLWIFRPADVKEDELRPCVFFIHGGGWGGSPESLAPQSLYLARRGVVCVSIHFNGPKPSPKGCLADSLSAYRWVKQNGKKYNIDPDRIVVSGGSAGGHLSLAMVTIPGCDHPDDDLSIPIDPKALILFNPAIDLVDGWGGGAKKCEKAGIDPSAFSPARFVKSGLPETLILSGGKDRLVPLTMVNTFMEQMKQHGNKCSFVEYPDAGHSFFNYGKEDNVYFHQTMDEVEKFLCKLGYIDTPKATTR
jgi:acetyl esterase